MAKDTDKQIKDAKDAMAHGKPLPSGVRIRFGDPEPIQKVSKGDDKPVKQDEG